MLGSHLLSLESVIRNITSWSWINFFRVIKSQWASAFASSDATQCPGIGIQNLSPYVSASGYISLIH